jgi:hypothetical protein
MQPTGPSLAPDKKLTCVPNLVLMHFPTGLHVTASITLKADLTRLRNNPLMVELLANIQGTLFRTKLVLLLLISNVLILVLFVTPLLIVTMVWLVPKTCVLCFLEITLEPNIVTGLNPPIVTISQSVPTILAVKLVDVFTPKPSSVTITATVLLIDVILSLVVSMIQSNVMTAVFVILEFAILYLVVALVKETALPTLLLTIVLFFIVMLTTQEMEPVVLVQPRTFVVMLPSSLLVLEPVFLLQLSSWLY